MTASLMYSLLFIYIERGAVERGTKNRVEWHSESESL